MGVEAFVLDGSRDFDSGEIAAMGLSDCARGKFHQQGACPIPGLSRGSCDGGKRGHEIMVDQAAGYAMLPLTFREIDRRIECV